MKEKVKKEDTTWLQECTKNRFSDSPEYQSRSVDILEEISQAPKEKSSHLRALALDKSCREIYRRHAFWRLTSLSEEFAKDEQVEVINLLRKLTDDKENEEGIRTWAYKDYRYLKNLVFGGLTKDELAKEKELGKTETSLQMQWLRYMRD